MSSHVELPREGHLEAAVNVMAHDGQKYNYRMVYDPPYLEIDHNVFKTVIGQSYIKMTQRQYP